VVKPPHYPMTAVAMLDMVFSYGVVWWKRIVLVIKLSDLFYITSSIIQFLIWSCAFITWPSSRGPFCQY